MQSGVVAFAFGAPATILSNRRIAYLALKTARALSCNIYTQLDVEIGGTYEEHHVHRVEEESGFPPSTLHIARSAVLWALDHEIEELHVVAAQPHLWRAMRDMQAAIQEVGLRIPVHAVRGIPHCKHDSWFCSNSTQERTRSLRAWRRRERILKELPLWAYKRIAI